MTREAGGTSMGSSAENHRSPGIAAALSRLHEDRPCHVLDLGPAISRNVDFFSSFPCRLRIVDLLGMLAGEPESAARLEREPAAFLAELLPSEGPPVDLVLAWSVFDHIKREQAGLLVSRLASMTRPGALLYALVATRHSDNRSGLAFAIRDHETLEYRLAAPPAHRCAAFNPAAFAQLLEGFAVDHSFVLRHGFQEFVAVRTDGV